MGWERRGKNGVPVYYRKVRVGGKVKSVYCGSGERGQAAAREDEERRSGSVAAEAAEEAPASVAAQFVIRPSTKYGFTVRQAYARAHKWTVPNPSTWVLSEAVMRGDYDERIAAWIEQGRPGAPTQSYRRSYRRYRT